MPRLKAWGQGSEASAHRQVVQCPTGTGLCKGLEPVITNLVRAKAKILERGQRPALHRLGESGEACVPDLVAHESKFLRIAHQTKGMSQESARAKSQGMGTRQWGASTPASCPAPRWHKRSREHSCRRRRSRWTEVRAVSAAPGPRWHKHSRERSCRCPQSRSSVGQGRSVCPAPRSPPRWRGR